VSNPFKRFKKWAMKQASGYATAIGIPKEVITAATTQASQLANIVIPGPTGDAYAKEITKVGTDIAANVPSGIKPLDPTPEAPRADYDLTDEMVQASRKYAAQRASAGFGLTRTFLTRSLDAPDAVTPFVSKAGQKDWGGEAGGAGSGAPEPVAPTVQPAAALTEEERLYRARVRMGR
jgi:hypothetical protein